MRLRFTPPKSLKRLRIYANVMWHCAYFITVLILNLISMKKVIFLGAVAGLVILVGAGCNYQVSVEDKNTQPATQQSQNTSQPISGEKNNYDKITQTDNTNQPLVLISGLCKEGGGVDCAESSKLDQGVRCNQDWIDGKEKGIIFYQAQECQNYYKENKSICRPTINDMRCDGSNYSIEFNKMPSEYKEKIMKICLDNENLIKQNAVNWLTGYRNCIGGSGNITIKECQNSYGKDAILDKFSNVCRCNDESVYNLYVRKCATFEEDCKIKQENGQPLLPGETQKKLIYNPEKRSCEWEK